MKEQKNYNVSIKKIFDESNKLIQKTTEKDSCYNSNLYENIDETEKLVLLHIFNNNIDDIMEFLNSNDNSKISSCKNFVNKCVQLYKSMDRDLCSKDRITDKTKIFTCDIVKKFKELYCSNIYNKLARNNDFQDLSYNTTINNMEGCPSEEIQSNDASTVQIKGSDPSLIQSVPPALGIMAGIPPLLVLTYKFTPARRWINWALHGNKKGINNNLYSDKGNEILFDGNVHSKYNTYNIGYEAAQDHS
ncbi:hypothetical protein PCYB_005810 [Plasmodium cynomolgi strain B]|uniref:Uncharacterized protein n=1 Tax=Plasmodium cynomolgi (strain B) TaxID=1120755 RepID=K6VK60_PLACD|nr:hypothetical protein PCYB_005810 [Plasmodium cynomolgi strain B]GAB69832.1 hypothetical protein PCYB_005810 [Plasmodium cynomolgi strain B]